MQTYLDKIKEVFDKVKAFFNTTNMKYGAFLVGATTAGILVFEGMFGMPLFFTVLFTVVGTQIALKYLARQVMGLEFTITKEKKL